MLNLKLFFNYLPPKPALYSLGGCFLVVSYQFSHCDLWLCQQSDQVHRYWDKTHSKKRNACLTYYFPLLFKILFQAFYARSYLPLNNFFPS